MNSFLQGKKILSAAPLTRPAGVALPNGLAAKAPRATGQSHAHGATAAHVEVVKEGDKVVRLVVTCVCGERVEIECLYPAGS
jgi:CO/xanthine dehydrogenase Mo-binding subunit